MSTEADPSLPSIHLPVKRDHSFYLWGKTKAALKYIYDHHLNDADWFLKADDDTYVIVENLHRFLQGHDANEPVYFGRRLKHGNYTYPFMSGGAGYVLSKESLVRFVRKALPHPKLCKAGEWGPEDSSLGEALHNVGVYAGDSRDRFGRERFHPFTPIEHIFEHRHKWLPIKNWHTAGDSPEYCCSDSSISFHYVSPSSMYLMEYLVYQISLPNVHMKHNVTVMSKAWGHW